MRIDVLTLFPEIFDAPMNSSMMWKAREHGFLDFQAHNIRDWADNKHKTVDDTPYGGGGGMLMRVDVIVQAVEAVRGDDDVPVIFMSPIGKVFNHAKAVELSKLPRMILLCGHYEGIDERVRDLVVTDEISIGDYVLTGGELAAMVVTDAVVRQIPGVLGAETGAAIESHADGLLEGPHYTRPAEFRGLGVPEVLKNGNHGAIAKWRRQQALRRTWFLRPELLKTAPLSEEDAYFLAELAKETAKKLKS